MPEQPLGPGDPPRIGRYQVVARLGRGGMATVYLGRGERGRKVAIKLIQPDLAADEGFRRRFEREVAYARRVRQAYIAPVLDAGEHEGRPFLVTEYIEGPTVAEAVRVPDPMPAHEVEQLGEQVVSALAAIHAVNLVHRDLKPSNVILGRTGPRVIDFGIARALDDSGGLTSQNVRLGTPSYMAPEQFDPDLEVDKPADVFAWGGLMVFASTGRPPFGTATNQREVAVLAHRVATYEPSLNGLEEPLRTLVREAMAKEPTQRPTARELVRRLSAGDQPTPTGAAPGTEQPAATEAEPTAPVTAPAFAEPTPPGPQGPMSTAHPWTEDGWRPAGVPADSHGAVLPAWTALLVRVGIAVGAILLVWLGWLLLPEAARLLLVVIVAGAVVLGAVAVAIWRSPGFRPGWLLWPLGGLALLAVFLWFTFGQLTGQTWVGFDHDRVAVLQGAGPDGHMGARNITLVERSSTDRRQLPTLLTAALDEGMGVRDLEQGRELARCLPWVFTPTESTPTAVQAACRLAVSGAPRRLPTPDHLVVEGTEHPPAMAATDDRVLFAWTDGDNRRLHVSSSFDGTHVEPSPEPLGEAFESDREPALATDGDTFFLAWRDPAGHLALASSTDGEDFGQPLVLDQTTVTAPALAYGNDTLLLAWVGDGNQLQLWPAADADSLQFLPEQQRPLLDDTRRGTRGETSPAAPNLLFAGENWYLTWAGTDNQVNIRTYTGDLRPLDKDTLQPRDAPSTRQRPAIAALDVFIVAWTRPDGLVGLLVAKSNEPAFVNQLALDVRSGSGVYMTTFRGQVLLSWAGDNLQPGGHVLRLP